MAATNKCLAPSNKSRTRGKATKKRSNPVTKPAPPITDAPMEKSKFQSFADVLDPI